MTATTAGPGKRHRRPSGAPPPLPRHIPWTTRVWVVLLIALIAMGFVARHVSSVQRAIDQMDAAILRAIASVRTSALTTVADGVNDVVLGWTMFAIGAGLVLALIVLRRWQHLFAYLGSVLVVEVIGLFLIDLFERPRPFDVTTIGDWEGFAFPSAPAVIVSFTVVGLIYGLVVAGRPRAIAKAVGAVVIGVVIAARLYLAADHPTDVLVGIVLATAIPLLAFRFFAPNEAFPVSYRRRKAAHLDIDDRRADAIRSAVSDQLGLRVLDMGPIGLAGSGGSTPLRLRLDDGRAVFGKLYAKTHVRADRWYKTFRTILYGRLEDEAPFQSVRRLAQQEDYTLRVMRDAGIPTAAPVGIVELTPEREYLVVTEFFEGSREITEADVDDDVIDQGVAVVRRLWDAGLAHRDIKPANVLVRDGELLLIDVAFAQVRPSPWREAVDLANMMLVLAVCTDAERVYTRALRLFTPDEIAEAFAAARGIASPTQLRTVMRRDGRDLIGRFRALAPPRRPISLQRWGPRRILYAIALLVAAVLLIPTTLGLFTPTDLPVSSPPTCGPGPGDVMILMAQSVPTAIDLPCITVLPGGWNDGNVSISHLRTRFSLDSDQAGQDAVVVTLEPSCSTDGAREEPLDLPEEVRLFVRPPAGAGAPTMRWYVADGACTTYRLDAALTDDPGLLAAIDASLTFQPRNELVARVESEWDLTLCGVSAPPCEGGAS